MTTGKRTSLVRIKKRFKRCLSISYYLSGKISIRMMAGIAKFFVNTRFGREAFFEAAPKNELLLAHTAEGIYYIVNSSDKVIGKSIYRDKKSFDSHHLTNALNLMSCPKSILIDVGANIGTIGLLGISKGLVDKCVAFEPEPNNFEILRHNVSLNGLSGRFDLRNEALSSEATGSLDFELSDMNFGDHRIRIKTTSGIHDEANRKIISVSVNTLDKALENVNLDECILFMDTQGYEGHVLSGAKKLVHRNVPIVTEFWPYGLKRSGGLKLFYDVLNNAGYTSMWDLKKPSEELQFSVDALKVLAEEIGYGEGYTDLLFVKT